MKPLALAATAHKPRLSVVNFLSFSAVAEALREMRPLTLAPTMRTPRLSVVTPLSVSSDPAFVVKAGIL
jgi:hypothetical protein